MFDLVEDARHLPETWQITKANDPPWPFLAIWLDGATER